MGRFTKDPTSANPYLRAGHQSRESYLRKLAEDFDVPLRKVRALAELFGPEEDFDALRIAVDDLSDKGA